MLKAFLDESGHSADPKSDAVCMGGCIGSLESCSFFENEWKAVLDEFEVSNLHMKDFEYNYGEFQKWKDKPEPHKALLERLLEVMNRHVDLYFGAADNINDYKVHPQPKVDPWYNCFMACIDTAAQYAFSLGQQIEIVFSDHKDFAKQARRYYAEVRTLGGMYTSLGPDNFESPSRIVQLQAADLVAYELRKEYLRRHGYSAHKIRYPFTYITRNRYKFGIK